MLPARTIPGMIAGMDVCTAPSPSRYTNAGCRCTGCRQMNSAKSRLHRLRAGTNRYRTTLLGDAPTVEQAVADDAIEEIIDRMLVDPLPAGTPLAVATAMYRRMTGDADSYHGGVIWHLQHPYDEHIITALTMSIERDSNMRPVLADVGYYAGLTALATAVVAAMAHVLSTQAAAAV